MLRSNKAIKWAAAMFLLAAQAGVRAEPTTQPAGKAVVTVSVVDADGKAVNGATVGIVVAQKKKDAGGVRPTPITTATTDADGKATLKDLPDGSYTVQARLKGAGNGKAVVAVTDQKDASVTVTLKPKAPKAQ